MYVLGIKFNEVKEGKYTQEVFISFYCCSFVESVAVINYQIYYTHDILVNNYFHVKFNSEYYIMTDQIIY